MKILMIGLGSIGQRHVRNIRRLYGDSVEIIAYRVRRLQQTFSDTMQIREGVNLEEEHNITSFSDLDEALNQKPDVAFITNITAKHMECAIKCAKAGCDIFLEKPVSDRLEGFSELQKIADEKKIIIFMGYQNRYHPAIKKLREYLDADKIGRLITVDAAFCERLITMHTYEDYSTTYMARSEMGGGPVLNLQIHDIDILQWLFGMPEGIKECVLTGVVPEDYEYDFQALATTNSSLKIDVEDNAVISYRTIYKGNPVTITTKSDFLCYPPVHTFRLIGEQGRIDIDMNKAVIDCYDYDGNVETTKFEDFQRNDMFIEELKDFMDSVNTRKPAKIPYDEGIKGLLIAVSAKL